MNPTGSRLWRFKYRRAGKEKLLAFGAYPAIGLKQARLLRDEARANLANGLDPATLKKEAKITNLRHTQNTFDAVAARYIEKKAKREKRKLLLKRTSGL